MTTPPTPQDHPSGSISLAGGETQEERGWLKPGATEVQRHWSFVEDGTYQEPNRVRNVTTWPDGSEYRSAWREVPS